MAINEDLKYRTNIPTEPDLSETLTGRLGRTTEIAKDVFVWELRHFFDNQNSPDRLDVTPVVMKFASDLPAPNRELDPFETVVRIVRAFPDINEKLPYVVVSATSGKNLKLAMSGKYVDAIISRPRLIAGQGSFPPPLAPPAVVPPNPDLTQFDDNNQPGVPNDWPYPLGTAQYGLVSADYVTFTTSFDGREYTDTILFSDLYLGVSPQTPRMLASIINTQALYCRASVEFYSGTPTLIIEPGGVLGKGKYTTIQRTDASANFDANVNLITTKESAPSDKYPVLNRYMNSVSMTISLIVGTDGVNIRTELTDLLHSFFAFTMDDRHFTFYGRSFFHADISDETYQIIIKDSEINVIGKQEVPRPDDPMRKVYINKIDIPIIMHYYVDRKVQMGAAVQSG